jgi:hypothetical protein
MMTAAMLRYVLPITCALMVASGTNAIAHAGDQPTVIVRWNEALLQAVRDSRMAPPMTARALAVVHSSMFDAWAAYDRFAEGTRFGSGLRRPVHEHTEWHKTEAVSVAAHRALVDLFPAQRAGLFDPLLLELGYAPRDTAPPGSPAAIGLAAAGAVIAFRHHDGANQLGNLTASGVPYADYTGYTPVNDPLTLTNPNRWQPLLQGDGTPQRYLAPQWRRVTPFALTSASQFRPPRPALFGTRDYVKQAIALVATSAALTDRMKAIAVYWADGPSTETPPGHWMLFAQAVSARDRNSIDDDVKLFFALANALLDASIAAWDCKSAFDSVRPVSAIRFLFAGFTIPSWAGPNRGTELIDGSEWRTYIPTPPFAEYVSGHSTFSAAAATVLRRFTGSDALRMSATIAAGRSPIEPGFAPAADVTLAWRTFSDAADQAGLSRRFGGIHFRDGDLAGREMGQRVGEQAWRKAVAHFKGKRRDLRD